MSRAAVFRQFQVARQVLAHGLMPIIEPEVNIRSADREESDALLLDAILGGKLGAPSTEKEIASELSEEVLPAEIYGG